MAAPTKEARIVKFQEVLTEKEQQKAARWAENEPEVVRYAVLLIGPSKKDPTLTKYDKAMAKSLGLTEEQYLAAKANRTTDDGDNAS